MVPVLEESIVQSILKPPSLTLFYVSYFWIVNQSNFTPVTVFDFRFKVLNCNVLKLQNNNKQVNNNSINIITQLDES